MARYRLKHLVGAAIGLEVWAVAEMDTLSSHERGAADYDNA